MPCTSVDTKTDEIMQRVIREKFGSHTILTVAHKLDSILDYDKVIVLEEGRIIETGVPYDLLVEEGSHFRQLYYAGYNLEAGFGFGSASASESRSGSGPTLWAW